MARIGIAVVLVIALVGGYFYLQNTQTPEPPNDENQAMQESEENMQVQGESDEETKTYTLSEISGHDNEDSCWIAIESKVYDVTDFISSHPGGEAILMGCGSDATELYNDRPNESGAHSDRARSLLPDYYIGELE